MNACPLVTVADGAVSQFTVGLVADGAAAGLTVCVYELVWLGTAPVASLITICIVQL